MESLVRPPDRLKITERNMKDTWTRWKTAFEWYLREVKVKKDDNESRLSLLMALAGDEAQDRLETFTFEEEGDSEKYVKVMDKFAVNVTNKHGVYMGPKSFACDVGVCSNKELTRVICPACCKNFCLSHRHQVDHGCAKYKLPPERMTKTKAHIDEIIESKKSQPVKGKGKGRKSKVTAAKVALMKIKMSASGDRGLPETERVHLRVILPMGTATHEKPMYFSKAWSMGRVIDAAASIAGIQNNNNIATAKKLRLFDSDDGHMYSTEDSLQSQMDAESGIINGGTVIIEYVEDGTTELTQLAHYKL